MSRPGQAIRVQEIHSIRRPANPHPQPVLLPRTPSNCILRRFDMFPRTLTDEVLCSLNRSRTCGSTKRPELNQPHAALNADRVQRFSFLLFLSLTP